MDIRDRLAKAPIGAKVGVVLVGLAVITALNIFVTFLPSGRSVVEINDLIDRREKELNDANADYGNKKQIANDLNRFRREREILAQRFEEARAELPDQNRMDDLLQAFQEKAIKAGLQIARIEPKDPVPPSSNEFYAKIPISMQVDGNFHEIATFFDSLGRMQRIVNVSDIVLDSPKDVNGRVVLVAKFTATTFMFVEPPGAGPTGAKGTKGVP
jgi:type IV pilus assembly protein PilO